MSGIRKQNLKNPSLNFQTIVSSHMQMIVKGWSFSQQQQHHPELGGYAH